MQKNCFSWAVYHFDESHASPGHKGKKSWFLPHRRWRTSQINFFSAGPSLGCAIFGPMKVKWSPSGTSWCQSNEGPLEVDENILYHVILKLVRHLSTFKIRIIKKENIFINHCFPWSRCGQLCQQKDQMVEALLKEMKAWVCLWICSKNIPPIIGEKEMWCNINKILFLSFLLMKMSLCLFEKTRKKAPYRALFSRTQKGYREGPFGPMSKNSPLRGAGKGLSGPWVKIVCYGVQGRAFWALE